MARVVTGIAVQLNSHWKMVAFAVPIERLHEDGCLQQHESAGWLTSPIGWRDYRGSLKSISEQLRDDEFVRSVNFALCSL
jgi:hypothetical protein